MDRSAFTEWRMLMAERLTLLALRLVPQNHPHAEIMVRHLGAMAAETRTRIHAEWRMTGDPGITPR